MKSLKPLSVTIDQCRLIIRVPYVALLSTYVDTCGSDAPIAVVVAHNMNSGTNGNGFCRNSLASLPVSRTRRRVNRYRTAVRRFCNDCITTHT